MLTIPSQNPSFAFKKQTGMSFFSNPASLPGIIQYFPGVINEYSIQRILIQYFDGWCPIMNDPAASGQGIRQGFFI